MKGRVTQSVSQRRFFCESEQFDVLYPYDDSCRQRFPELELTAENILSHFPNDIRLCSSINDLDRSRGTVMRDLVLTSITAPDGTDRDLTKARVCFEVMIDDINHLEPIEVTSTRLEFTHLNQRPQWIECKTICFKTSHEHIVQLVSAMCMIDYSRDRPTFDLRDRSEQYLQKIAGLVKSSREEKASVEEIRVRRNGCCTIL